MGSKKILSFSWFGLNESTLHVDFPTLDLNISCKTPGGLLDLVQTVHKI